MLIKYGLYPFLAAAHDEVGFDVVLLQVGVPLSSCSRLHVIVTVQIVQSGLRDVDPPAKETAHTGNVMYFLVLAGHTVQKGAL